MRVKAIELDDEEQPATITVEMTHDEALFMAVVTGKNNEERANEVMPKGYPASSGIYDALVGSVFNRFYEDGVRDALKARRG